MMWKQASWRVFLAEVIVTGKAIRLALKERGWTVDRTPRSTEVVEID